MTGILIVLAIFAAGMWAIFRPRPPYQSEIDRIRAAGVGIDPAERERTFTRQVRRVS